MNLKDTLLMPKTSFNMKASLAHNEPKFQTNWEETKVYQQVMEKNATKPLFILHDGPPYANGDLHAGHALNKILKDFIIRSKNMSGFKAPMIMGWDTHGLPIENALLKKGKVKINKLTTQEFRDECSKYAMDQVENQKNQFFELGLMAERDLFYVTLDKKYEAEQIRVFSKLVESNIIYKGLKPVYWSPTSQSALAEAEIEYQEKTSPAIYVAMDLVDDIRFEAVEIVIWTTTPWTIPANRGVAVGADFKYAVIDIDGRKLLVATDLIESVFNDIGGENFKIIQEYLGSELEGVNVRHPFMDMTNTIMIGHHVTTESGTGCVHTAPGHGEDDFIIAKKYGIEVVSVVDAFGKMNENAGEFTGEFYENANKLIGEKLETCGKLLNLKFLKHSYPHDWRTKKPVIFRATAQWFASITPVKEALLNEIEAIDFQHDWGRVRLYNMIKGRDEWCISRQRKWGVPIPIFYAENEEPIMDHILIQHIANLFETHGSNIWFEKTAKELLPEGYTHSKSPNGIFTKEQDIMDVWFDSGSSHTAVTKRLLGQYQADLYFEGSDQYRGWFNSSIITGFIAEGKSPFKKLISHGFVLDGKGIKMSKSIGNVITPKQITSTKGADILRLWVASVDYQADVRVSDDIINQVSEIYRRFRNTL
nr:isoleucine--tRNA ligase [Colwellia sp.]